jgi:WD40 repeat protein
VLEAHEDEVWHLQFSHSGRYLATASKDGKTIVWEVAGLTELRVRHVLDCHTLPLAFVCWSPDDAHLVTCGADVVKLWDTATGALKATMNAHHDSITAAAWLPSGKRFVTGGLDKMIYVWDLEGNEAGGVYSIVYALCILYITVYAHMHSAVSTRELNPARPVALKAPGFNPWSLRSENPENEIPVSKLAFSNGVSSSTAYDSVRHWKGMRINDLAISADGKTLVTICMDKKITLRRFEDDGQVMVGLSRSCACVLTPSSIVFLLEPLDIER